MAASKALLEALFLVAFFLESSAASRDTRVEVTTVGPVTIGGILAIQCQVWNMRDTYMVNFFHDINGQTRRITVHNQYADNSLGQRSYLAKRTFPGGSHVFFLTVVNIEYEDEGKYICNVYSLTNGRQNDIAENSKKIRINTFPSKKYPSCQSAPDLASVKVGDMLLLKCTSERTFPLVTLTWSSSSDSTVSHDTHNTTSYSIVSFETSLVLKTSHNGAVFLCTMAIPGFPLRERTCMKIMDLSEWKVKHYNI